MQLVLGTLFLISSYTTIFQPWYEGRELIDTIDDAALKTFSLLSREYGWLMSTLILIARTDAYVRQL